METLDLKKFLWVSNQNKKTYIILAISDYRDEDVVVYREAAELSRICVKSVDEFCREFTATYNLS